LPRGLNPLHFETLDGKFVVPFKLRTKNKTEMVIFFLSQKMCFDYLFIEKKSIRLLVFYLIKNMVFDCWLFFDLEKKRSSVVCF